MGFRPNILISYCISRKLHYLPAFINIYNLEFCADRNLINEFSAVMGRERFKPFLKQELGFYIDVVAHFLSFYDTSKVFMGSPDDKDDYLIDIVQQSNSVGLITGDKALLNWSNAPIQIVSLNHFQQTYPL